MGKGVWIPVLLSIPISIGCTLITPYVSAWIERWGKRSHQKKRAKIYAEYREVAALALRPEMLLGQMMVTLIVLNLCGFIFLVIRFLDPALDVFVKFVPPHLIDSHRHIGSLIGASLELIGAIGITVLLTQVVLQSIKRYLQVRSFRTYVESIPKDMRDEEIEELILWARSRSLVVDRRLLRIIAKEEDEAISKVKSDAAAAQNTLARTPSDPSSPPPSIAEVP